MLYNKIELLSLRIGLQENFISETSALIEDISKSGDANVDNAIQVNQISKKVEQLELNYKELQDVIIGNPSNIIEFALLLKEVDTLKEGFVEHKKVIYAEIERSFGLFRWFIYINIFIALTILGSFIVSYLQNKKT